MAISAFMREKKITVGHAYMEVDIFARDTVQDQVAKRGTRNKKQNETRPAQQNLNSKNARRYLVQLANGNFGKDDLFVTLTYKPEYAPKDVEEAEKHVRNYLRRVARRRKRDHLEPLKYILVTEYRTDDDGVITGKIHHHLLMNHMDRDVVENLWKENRRKLGQVRTEWIDPDLGETGNGIEGLAQYIIKDPKGRKRWSSSRNLKRPVSRANDWKYRRRRVAAMADDPAAAYLYYAEKYPDWEVVSPIEYRYNQVTGEWACYLKMWRKQSKERRRCA